VRSQLGTEAAPQKFHRPTAASGAAEQHLAFYEHLLPAEGREQVLIALATYSSTNAF